MGKAAVKIVKSLASGAARVFAVSNSIAVAGIFIMMLLGTADILGRFVLSRPVPGTYEITESLLILVVFLALAYGESRQQHIRVQLVLDRLPPQARQWLNLLAYGAGAFLFSLIAWKTWQFAMSSWAIREFMPGEAPMPLYPTKFLLPIGCFFLVIQFLINFVGSLSKILARGEERQ